MDAQSAQIRQQARQAFDRRDYQSALDLYLSITARYPNFADIRHFAGLCLSFLGDAEGALEQFDYALVANPAYVVICASIARLSESFMFRSRPLRRRSVRGSPSRSRSIVRSPK